MASSASSLFVAEHNRKKVQAQFACIECNRYSVKRCQHKSCIPVSELQSYIVLDGNKPQGSSHIYRALHSPNPPTPFEYHGCKTVYEVFARSARLYGNCPMLGSRTVDKDGKLSPSYSWLTYKQVWDKADLFGSGLRRLGLQEKATVGLYSVNRPEWIIGEQACFMQNFITVPLYDTLGADAASFIIDQSEITTLLCSIDKVNSLLEMTRKMPNLPLRNIIVMPIQPFDDPKIRSFDLNAARQSAPPQVKIFTMTEVEAMGRSEQGSPGKLGAFPHVPPQVNDLATICYTSGTTGNPKGAMLSHCNFVSDCCAALTAGITPTPADSYFSFLPLAHVFERVVVSILIATGACIGFGRGSVVTLLEDVEAFKPTIFSGVPRLYNRIYDKVKQQVDEAGGLKKALFDHAFAVKKQNLQKGQYTHWLYDPLVFNKIRSKLGGRCRLMITGSAPIHGDVLSFLRICFSSMVLEGYGSTESTAATTVTNIFRQPDARNNIGSPLPCVELKLVDVPEMGYTSQDRDPKTGVVMPRGEICMRGSSIFLGYYKDPEKTREAFDEEGWLHSGDIGVWLPNGTLKIIDRKKNIFKLSQGEYIAPEKLENIYTQALPKTAQTNDAQPPLKLIAQCFVYGDSFQNCLVGIIVPDFDVLPLWAQRNGLEYDAKNVATFVKHPKLYEAIAKELHDKAVAHKLQGFELLKAFHIHHELFTSESGILTPTMKLKRDCAKKMFQKEIDDMYKQLEAKHQQHSHEHVKEPLRAKL